VIATLDSVMIQNSVCSSVMCIAVELDGTCNFEIAHITACEIDKGNELTVSKAERLCRKSRTFPRTFHLKPIVKETVMDCYPIACADMYTLYVNSLIQE
jgi:hypothetical protein